MTDGQLRLRYLMVVLFILGGLVLLPLGVSSVGADSTTKVFAGVFYIIGGALMLVGGVLVLIDLVRRRRSDR